MTVGEVVGFVGGVGGELSRVGGCLLNRFVVNSVPRGLDREPALARNVMQSRSVAKTQLYFLFQPFCRHVRQVPQSCSYESMGRAPQVVTTL